MKPAIYDQHDKAFNRVSAYVIARNGEKVATVAIKFPADGAGRLYAYVHWLGLEMVRGFANSYGYDKRSAAVQSAIGRIAQFDRAAEAQERRNAGYPAAAMQSEISEIADNEKLCRFKDAAHSMGGYDWTSALEKAGFTVWQAV